MKLFFVAEFAKNTGQSMLEDGEVGVVTTRRQLKTGHSLSEYNDEKGRQFF